MEQLKPAAAPVGRPRPWLLVALGVAVAVFAVTWLLPGKSAAPAAAPSNPRGARRRPERGASDPAARRQPRGAEAAAAGRRRAAAESVPVLVPPPPRRRRRRSRSPKPQPPPVVAAAAAGPPPPPPPPPITLKFIGLLERAGLGKVAAFSDCRRRRCAAREGDIIDGRYRLVRIGVESVVMEYLDGRGRTTIRMSGQECVTK